MHAYRVGQRIGQLAEDMLKVEEGTLYPALYRIEQRGWIESEWGISENNRRTRPGAYLDSRVQGRQSRPHILPSMSAVRTRRDGASALM